MTDSARKDVTVERPVTSGAWERQLPHIKRRLEAGNPLALYDGLVACRNGELPLPLWLMEATMELVKSALSGGAVGYQRLSGKRGKGNSILGEAQKAFRTHARGHMVWSIRQVQKDREDWIGLPYPLRQLFCAGEIVDFGTTEDDAFRIAHVALRGTYAQGAESTMRKAYRELQRRRRTSEFLNFVETDQAFLLRDPGELSSTPLPPWLDDWLAGRPVKS